MSRDHSSESDTTVQTRTGPTTEITLYERADGRRSIAYGAGEDETVVTDDGTRLTNHAVQVVALPGDLTFEEIRRAYARADSLPGQVSGWLGDDWA